MTLEWKPTGKQTLTVTARLDGDILAVENLTITKSKARESFAKKLCDGRPGIEQAVVETELMKVAAELAARGNGNGEPVDLGNLPELDTSQIIRPERFITPEVSGLAVPAMTTLGDEVVGRWLWYLRWSNGKRERRALGRTLDLPNGRRVYVHPDLAEPTPNMRSGWSAEARERWLKGESAPDPAELFRRLAERFAYFLDFPKCQAPGVTATLVCWVIHTYCYLAWPAVPYLYVGGPLASGKSRVFEILVRLAWRPLASSNMTAASLFRTLHSRGGVLLLDEAERLKSTRDPDVAEILSLLLAGHKASGSALRMEPIGDGGFRPVSFDVFGPKAMACISGVPPALASRCIPVTMFRAAPGSFKPKRRIDADPAGWQRLRDDLHALTLEYGLRWLGLADRNDVVPDGLNGRDFELWQPLLSLASWIEAAGARGLLGLLQEHALATAEAGRDDQTPDHDETLLRLLAEAVRHGERPTPGDLLNKAKEAELEAFKRWTGKAISEHLKRYGFRTHKSHGRRVYGRVTLDDLRTVEANYGLDLGLSDTDE